MSKSSKQTIYSLAAVAALGIAMSSPAMARKPDNPGQGPQVSASAVTVCEVADTNLVVTNRIRNNNVGEKAGDPVVTLWVIDALAKFGPGKWNVETNPNVISFETINEDFAGLPDDQKDTLHLKADPVSWFVKEIDLCDLVNGIVKGEPAELDFSKGVSLNVKSAITYSPGGLGGDGEKTILNSCSDDPDTIDVIEPAGIKLTADDVTAIRTSCESQL